MRKLLLSLATISIIGIPATAVVACKANSSTDRFNTPVLSKKINDEIFMSLLSDPNISPEIKGRYFSDIDFQKAVTTMLEDQISKVANNYFQNGLNKSLMLNNNSENFYNKKLDDTINTIAQNQFYLEYTKNLISNGSPLDIKINIGNDNLIPLNPSKLLQPEEISDVDLMDNNKYFVFYQSDNGIWKRWEYFDENDDGKGNIPQIKELENSKFVIVKKIDATDKPTLTDEEINGGGLIWLDGQTRHDDDKNFVYSLDGKTPYFMSGKVALQYRFQNYFRSQIRYSTDDKKSLAKRMLAITYLESNLFNVYRNEKADPNQPTNDEYLNIQSDIAQNVQSWNKAVGYQSKLKMVWSFTMNKTDAQKVWTSIRPYLNGNGQLIDSNFVSLKSLYQQIETTINVTNQSNLGSDPFFNLNGYNGIVKSGADGIISVDGNLLIDEAAKTKVQQANGPSILSEDGLGNPFKSNVKGKYDFVFVVPIYLIDLLNDKTQGYDHGLNTTIYVKKEDVKTELDPTKVFTSYSEAQNQGNRFKATKIEDINRALATSITNNTINNSYYIYDNMGASYTLNEWNQLKGKNYTPESIWSSLKDDSDANGLQVAIRNTHENTYGNIGINGEPVRLFKASDMPTSPPKGITFSLGNDGYLYASVSDPNLINDVQSFTIKGTSSPYYLSFDEATKEGVITTSGTINKTNSTLKNSTYGDSVNMGQNASDPNGYIRDDKIPYNYYEANITSLDIANLNTVNKTSLLREIESIVATDETVINRASSTIYPLFIKESDILFEPLYESLKKYLINEGGGTSD